jgi:hypothetical protein
LSRHHDLTGKKSFHLRASQAPWKSEECASASRGSRALDRCRLYWLPRAAVSTLAARISACMNHGEANDIAIEHQEAKHRFALQVDGGEAELTYRRNGNIIVSTTQK